MTHPVVVTGKIAADAAVSGTVVATVINYLPPAAALIGIIYYALLISENHRFLQLLSWFGRFRVTIRLPDRLQLVEDWRQGWRWLSIQLIAAAAAIQTVLVAFPLQRYIPPEWMKAAVIFCLIGAFLGRFVKQEGHGCNESVERSNGSTPRC